MTRDEMARVALRQAMKIRERASIDSTSPVCIFDLAEQLGLEVKFRPEKSLAGMYAKSPRGVILISAHRPPGHRAFTCAHEIGHHIFGHGTRVDEYVKNADKPWQTAPEEWLVNRFAAYLLMPLPAVIKAFKRRGWVPASCTALQAYTVASQLGVGYTTLIAQMSSTHGLLSAERADHLRRVTPKEIRNQVLGHDDSRHLVIVDQWWDAKVTADSEVGDHLLLPNNTVVEGTAVTPVVRNDSGTTVIAALPGTARAELPSTNWAIFVRVSKYQYTGRSLFRFLEDPDVN